MKIINVVEFSMYLFQNILLYIFFCADIFLSRKLNDTSPFRCFNFVQNIKTF